MQWKLQSVDNTGMRAKNVWATFVLTCCVPEEIQWAFHKEVTMEDSSVNAKKNRDISGDIW